MRVELTGRNSVALDGAEQDRKSIVVHAARRIVVAVAGG
jgi:hypothetical protein